MNCPIFKYRGSFIAATVTFFGVLVILYCSFAPGVFGLELEPAPPSKQSPSSSVIWTELLQKTPYPHTAPLPPPVRTILDGTYTKFDPKKTPPVPCRRCPDYMPEGGIWKLNLDKGVFRIFHEVTGWRSLGSFVVEGSQVRLFNDPSCMEVKGLYRWTVADGSLILQVIEDRCAIGLRAKNLTQLPWLPCETPAGDDALGNQRPKPSGCE